MATDTATNAADLKKTTSAALQLMLDQFSRKTDDLAAAPLGFDTANLASERATLLAWRNRWALKGCPLDQAAAELDRKLDERTRGSGGGSKPDKRIAPDRSQEIGQMLALKSVPHWIQGASGGGVPPERTGGLGDRPSR